MLKMTSVLCGVMCLLAAPALAGKGEIDKRIAGVDDGIVHMTFASRDGVCGDGRSISMGQGEWHVRKNGHTMWRSDDEEWEVDCDEGPVHVSLRVRDGEVTRIRTRVGGRWRSRSQPDVTDLGEVSPQDAVDFLLWQAEFGRESASEDAILPAILARDVVVWPGLMKIARNRRIEDDTRKSAVFWLGQLAGKKVTEGLAQLVDDDDVDLDVRKSAIFALSQQDERESMERLAEIARSNRHPQLRKSALFWLAQSDSPYVLDFFEEILTRN